MVIKHLIQDGLFWAHYWLLVWLKNLQNEMRKQASQTTFPNSVKKNEHSVEINYSGIFERNLFSGNLRLSGPLKASNKGKTI